MRLMKESADWRQWASVSLCVTLWILGIFLGLKYLLPLFLPFLLAFVFSLMIRPLALRVSDRLHLPYKGCAFFLTFLILCLTVLGAFLGVSRLFRELHQLLTRLDAETAGTENVVTKAMEWFRSMGDKIPFVQRFLQTEEFQSVRDRTNEILSAAVSAMAGRLGEQIPDFVGGIAAAMPTVLLFAVTFTMSCFYFSTDSEKIRPMLMRYLPQKIRTAISVLKPRLKDSFLKYLRAYLLLMVITFVILFVGFSVIRVEYAFLLSLITAVVDLLPVFGVGTVLIPWAVVRFLMQDYHTGFGLLILFGVVLLVRQIVEPHLVGESLGLHPLLTLIAMYAGFRFAGIWGLFLSPALLLILRLLLPSDEKKESAVANSLKKQSAGLGNSSS